MSDHLGVTGDPVTLGGLRRFVARCDDAGIPDDVQPDVRATFRGKLRGISASNPERLVPPTPVADPAAPPTDFSG
ncbi:hypothetical protein [Glutamicibacter sp. V16R2B1]|uniref:hypothetical protein n=1 Tax=Glutamicibacter sp. V16R2B1 TaxID=2036207 RepID=UPI0010FF40EE|nr:hypothetical protein [Glutamicibacter sp. V16R2B1]MCK9901249.1 hypothetical protein [Frankia sp. Cpl3]TLK46881.1 hypothetical protein FDN03_16095 [Glutamicibacter sp. V16R2B1]